MTSPTPLAERFRGFMPVIIDVETGGFNPLTDALLEIAAVTVKLNPEGNLVRDETHRFHTLPFENANIEAASLEVNRIDPHHPLRPAIPERDALQRIFREIRASLRASECTRAILVGHNAHFDLSFVNEAVRRTGIKRNPFHPFSVLDTASIAGVALGQTVLARAVRAAGMDWDATAAHSAAYDAELTADLFCTIVNRFQPIFESRRPLPAEEPDEIDSR